MSLPLRKDATGKDLTIKSFAFEIKECKQAKNDPTIGIIRGYASTFGNVDRGDDIVAPGAFDRTIMDHRQRGNRPIRLYANHRSIDILGGIPIDSVKVDAVGLFIEAHLDLNVVRAAEIFSLARKGFISDFSIGFSRIKSELDEENNIRTLTELDLFEVSLVNEPMNQLAQITDVDDNSKRRNDPNYNPKEESDMADKKTGTEGHVMFTDEKGNTITVDSEGKVVATTENNQKNFDVKDVESLTSNAEVEELLKSAGFSKEARKALISKVRKGFESDGRDDQEDSDGRDDQSANRREAENVETLLSTLTDFKSTLTTKPTED